MNAFTNSLGVGFLPVRPPIGEALAFDLFEDVARALLVVDAEADAVVVAEIEFRDVAVRMVLAAVLIDALHSALEDREVASDRVGVDIAAHILVLAVLDRIMGRILGADLPVEAAFVGHEAAFAADVLTEQGHDVRDRRLIDMERTDHAATLDEAEHGALMAVARAGLLMALLETDVRLVGFHGLTGTADRRERTGTHGLADAMRHEPSGFVGHAKCAGQLVAADALLRRAQKIGRKQPLMKFDMARLKHGADFHREVLAALLGCATVLAGALRRIRLIHRAAMRAYRTVRPADRLKVLAGGCFVGELRRVELAHDNLPQSIGKAYILRFVASSI